MNKSLYNATPAVFLAVFLAAPVSIPSAQAQTTPIPAVAPQPDATISANRIKAQRLFQAITAVRVPIDDSRITQMESLIAVGNLKGAAAIATADPLFYDVQVRDIAKIMSTRDETVRAPMSDFVATFIGVVRDSDQRSAKEILTGNFYYRVDPAIIATLPANATVRQNELPDILRSNNHYADMVARNLSPYKVLIAQSPQRAVQNNVAINHPNPAGLLTTRAFTEAHAIDGTNRRPIQEMMEEFMCVRMAEWSDPNAPDDRVSQDVTRTPGGSFNVYQSTCKACHTGMDAMRGAWAFTDFTGGAQTIVTGVLGKMTRNSSEFPQGYRITNDSWVINSYYGKNQDQLGWRGTLQGNGLSSLASAIASSRGFSRCMVRKAFRAICRRNPLPTEESLVRSLADDFETDGYHARRMYENVAVNPACLQ